jgi:hypothetical protein
VLSEKIFSFFHFFKSFFKLLRMLGACLLHLLEYLQPVELLLGLRQRLGAYPTRLKQSVLKREIEYSTDF